jgi:hypothetical protein
VYWAGETDQQRHGKTDGIEEGAHAQLLEARTQGSSND